MRQKVFLKDGVIEFYLINKSLRLTAEKFQYKPITLYRLLKSAGVDTTLDATKLRHKSIKYPINENYFKDINTSDKAYIFGIIMSDGHLLKNRKQLRIKLTDINLLEDIKKRIVYDKPLIFNKNYIESHKQTASLIICNTKMYDDLISAGMIQNKTYINKYPFVKYDLQGDFIRGFFDGNGCIYKYPNRNVYEAKIVSTKIFCDELLNILSSFNIHSVVERDKRTDERIAAVRIRRISDVIKFGKLMYGNKDCISLKRKREIFNTLFHDNM